MNNSGGRQPSDSLAQPAFERLLVSLRPKLHRYCTRMVGSAIDAEDVVQDTLAKTIEAYPGEPAIANTEAWLFRIAHNTALDFLRRRAREQKSSGDEDIAMIADPIDQVHQRQAAAAALSMFMRLPVAQRSSVILMDVLGYSLDEIGRITGATIPAVKASLHRGREALREAIEEPEDRAPPTLSATERLRLSVYVERFNARDFDAIRAMLAEDVQLELVNKTRMNGRAEVGRYFGNYAQVFDWHLEPGFVDRRPAIIVRDSPTSRPSYFVLLHWETDHINAIRDFRHARYVTESAEILPLV
jgi:RNA polymerase sigma-70 factor (ECF subfamily)